MRGIPERAPRADWRGFTLVELLVVISIICLLMGLLIGVIRAMQVKSQKMQTRMAVDVLKSACESYRGNHGRYPWAVPESVGPATAIDPAEVYAELRSRPGAIVNRTTDYLSGLDARFVKTVAGKDRVQDAWGSEIVFRLDPANLRPVIWSRGPDRVDDTNFEDPPAAYANYVPPAPPPAYSDPARFPRRYYCLGDGRVRGDDLGGL